MKKNLLSVAVLATTLSLASCGGSDKDAKPADDKKAEPSTEKVSAASLAAKWCELNGVAYKAAEGAEKEAAKAARKTFEKEMEDKYKADEAFYKEIQQEVEKCEDASEGR